MSTLSNLFHNIELAAEHAAIDVEAALIFLAKFAKASTPIAEAVETVSGNAELIPITTAVSSAVQTVGAVAVAQAAQQSPSQD